MFEPAPPSITPWIEWVPHELHLYNILEAPFCSPEVLGITLLWVEALFVFQKCWVSHFYEQFFASLLFQQWQRLNPLCPRKMKDLEFGSKGTFYDPGFHFLDQTLHFLDQTLQVQRSRISPIFEIKLLLKMHRTCVSASERNWTRSSVLTRLVKLRFFLPT